MIAAKILDLYEAGEFDVCTIVFNRFKSAMTQVLTVQQLVPVEPPALDADAARQRPARPPSTSSSRTRSRS